MIPDFIYDSLSHETRHELRMGAIDVVLSELYVIELLVAQFNKWVDRDSTWSNNRFNAVVEEAEEFLKDDADGIYFKHCTASDMDAAHQLFDELMNNPRFKKEYDSFYWAEHRTW